MDALPCNILANQRKLKFQSNQPENSPCSAQIGFKLDGSLARDFWLSSPNPQIDTKWLWLNEGGLLEYRNEDEPLANYTWLVVTPRGRAQMRLVGINEIGGCPDTQEPATIVATLELQLIDVFGPTITDEEEAIMCKLHPPNNSIWTFEDWHTILPPDTPESSIVPPLLVTPLRACHDCTNDS